VDQKTENSQIEQNITKARRTAYSLLSTGFYGKNGLDPITFVQNIVVLMLSWPVASCFSIASSCCLHMLLNRVIYLISNIASIGSKPDMMYIAGSAALVSV
jgi:hypothetical protein